MNKKTIIREGVDIGKTILENSSFFSKNEIVLIMYIVKECIINQCYGFEYKPQEILLNCDFTSTILHKTIASLEKKKVIICVPNREEEIKLYNLPKISGIGMSKTNIKDIFDDKIT